MALVAPAPRIYTAGELFCGAGGLSRGFHALGFAARFANDVWPIALHTFLMNFDPLYAASNGKKAEVVALPGSVEDIEVAGLLESMGLRTGERFAPGDLDVLLGGPPCQGYSVNSHIRSAEDPRNFLFRHYVRLLKGLAPKVFVLENVPGMLSLDGGRFLDELLAAISAASPGFPGYEVDFKILNAAHYGVPQDRFRIVVVGTRRDVASSAGKVELPAPRHYSLAQAHFKGGRSHTFHYATGYRRRLEQSAISQIGPKLLPPICVGEAIEDLPPLTNGGGSDLASYVGAREPSPGYQRDMRGKAEVLANHWCRALVYPNTERVKHIPAGGDWRDIPRGLLPPGMQRALRKDHTKRYGRLSSDEISGTLLTKPDPHWGTFIHYDEAQQRLISVREAARFQSFPDCHVFHGGQVDQYKLCGNAVPPLMAQAIAENAAQVLDVFYGMAGSRPDGRAAETRA
jgi:DNA (cytosine-5)-methyltransferase 1